MTHRILWQAPDGTLKFTIPIEPPLPGESAALYLDRIALAAQATDPGLAGCVHLGPMPTAALPVSRRFRNCWRSSGGTVQVALPAARQQLLDELRAERNRRLLASDADRVRLTDIGSRDEQTALTTYRQHLRDLPASAAADLAALSSVAELEAYQPTWPVPTPEQLMPTFTGILGSSVSQFGQIELGALPGVPKTGSESAAAGETSALGVTGADIATATDSYQLQLGGTDSASSVESCQVAVVSVDAAGFIESITAEALRRLLGSVPSFALPGSIGTQLPLSASSRVALALLGVVDTKLSLPGSVDTGFLTSASVDPIPSILAQPGMPKGIPGSVGTQIALVGKAGPAPGLAGRVGSAIALPARSGTQLSLRGSS